MQRILIVGAHYDDAELGAGGTAAKLVAEGKTVYKITLTDNRTEFVQRNIFVGCESSETESARACKTLGVTELPDFKTRDCGKLVYSQEVMQEVEAIIFDKNIDTVFMHFNHDMNQDHVEASRICMTAARHCDNILAYQSNVYQLDKPFYPSFFVDISKYVDKKRAALACYGTEHNRYNKLFETNVERNHIWGYSNEVEYAEGFHVIKFFER